MYDDLYDETFTIGSNVFKNTINYCEMHQTRANKLDKSIKKISLNKYNTLQTISTQFHSLTTSDIRFVT